MVWAATLLVAPGPVITRLGGEADATGLAVARLLGVRHALQGAVEVASWPRWARGGSAIDAAHALTALLLSGVDSRRRRIALIDAAVAGSFAALGYAVR